MSILISHCWLQELLGVSLDVSSLPEMLTNAGIEVDAVIKGKNLSNKFVIGRIVSASRHPNAEKLSLCKVDIGTEVLDIVCGCKSVKENVYVIVARIGAVLPSGIEIKPAMLRGEPSNGMLCSFAELGLAKESSGIVIFDEDAQLGLPVTDILESDDILYDISLTPDRGDCYSIRGIAREAYALQYESVMPEAKVCILEDSLQPAFPDTMQFLTYKIAKKNQGTQLLWCRRLQAAGYQSQSYWVDFTQYYMHELGQPMHAYDADKIKGKLHVRYAKTGESIEILGGKKIDLNQKILIVADDNGPVAIAGVVGGARTAVSENTNEVILEVASFDKTVVAKNTQLLKLHTAASDRFARGVDPFALHLAHAQIIKNFSENIISIAGYSSKPVSVCFNLKFTSLNRVLGEVQDPISLVKKLELRGFVINLMPDSVDIEIPTFRTDINTEIDVIEEILRLAGHQYWPSSDFSKIVTYSSFGSSRDFAEILKHNGFNEMITYSFINPRWIDDANNLYQIANPMSQEMSVMRPSIIPGLLDCLQYNFKRQLSSARVFEMGKVFTGTSENNVLTAITAGEHPPTWQKHDEDDFYYLKGIVLNMLNGYPDVNFVPCSDNYWLHPHASAEIYLADTSIGYVGKIHPRILSKFALENAICFEIDFDKISSNLILKPMQLISKYPYSRKDLSFFADKSVKYNDILSAIYSLDIPNLRNVELFDLYYSEKISYSISFTFQSFEKTVSDMEILENLSKTVSFLKSELNLELRGDL